jgi:glycogen debranching enzyme
MLSVLHRFRLLLGLCCILALFAAPVAVSQNSTKQSESSLELTRAARSWEFLGAFGSRAGVFGHEDGRFEVWTYPLKVLRNLRLRFHTEGRVLEAESLARSVSVRPGSSTIIYAGDAFQIRQTLFIPVDQPGAIFLLDVTTAQPIEIEVQFERDLQLMWPAAIGGTFMNWDAESRAFALGEEQRRFFARVGSPDARDPQQEYFTISSSSAVSSFRLGRLDKGRHVQTIAIAASFEGADKATGIYRTLVASAPELLEEVEKRFASYLDRTVQLRLPDADLQLAYDWSRISLLEGLVGNPFLGTGLVAGYRTSGRDARPGFAWFFGRDALWTAWALIAAGDFDTTRTALEFLSRYQRDDGKIPHEIAQSASFVRWFEDFPYGYASADATPLYLLTMNEYATASGDVAFANLKWESISKAYAFLRSTFDENDLAKNQGVGHGWVEGGPLLPVKAEYYQSGLGVAAMKALSSLARLTGKPELAKQADAEYQRMVTRLEQAFWQSKKSIYAFALDEAGQPVAKPSVLATVPMWFDLPAPENAQRMIDTLSATDHLTDWGMRILSASDPSFSPEGYHYGSVWPLFTGWAAVGAYRYHRAHFGYANLRANALLALHGSLGRVTEVLSGSQHVSLSTSSPHQIWSAAMVVSPLLHGLLGLEHDALARRLRLSPHLPAHWREFEVRNVQVGDATLDLRFTRGVNFIQLEWESPARTGFEFEFSPAISLRARVTAVDANQRPVPFEVRPSPTDQHVVVRIPRPQGRNTLRIRVENDFGFHYEPSLPALGDSSSNLKIVSETWSERRDRLDIHVQGRPGRAYTLFVRGADQVASVQGAELERPDDGAGRLQIRFAPAPNSDYVNKQVVLRFAQSKP